MTTGVLAEVAPGLCATCGGSGHQVVVRLRLTRNVVTERFEDASTCTRCGGDGLARSVGAALADAARLSVGWLT